MLYYHILNKHITFLLLVVVTIFLSIQCSYANVYDDQVIIEHAAKQVEEAVQNNRREAEYRYYNNGQSYPKSFTLSPDQITIIDNIFAAIFIILFIAIFIAVYRSIKQNKIKEEALKKESMDKLQLEIDERKRIWQFSQKEKAAIANSLRHLK